MLQFRAVVKATTWIDIALALILNSGMSSPNASISRSSYNVPISESSALLDPGEHPVLADFEPAFMPLALAGLAGIEWAGRDDHDLLAVPPLNNLAHPPLHPDFVRQSAKLSRPEAAVAQAGAAILAFTSAYQSWIHASGTEVANESPAHREYTTKISQEITTPEARRMAGNIIHSPGLGWEVADIAAFHGVSSEATGGIRLSAAIETNPSSPAGSSPSTRRYYCLNLETTFHGRPAASHMWATAQIEAGMLDNDRFMLGDEGVNFMRLVKAAQILSSLAIGEGYLANVPMDGYQFTQGRPGK